MKRAPASRVVKEGIAIPVAASSFNVPIADALKHWVTGGFIAAVLLTVSIGFSSWRSTQLSANDSDWVVHTYAVIQEVKITHQHVVEVETSARTFALAGQAPLLAHYVAARDSVPQDLHALRRMTADNPNQQRRLDVLEPQVRAALEFAAKIVAERQQKDEVATGSEVLETESLMSAVGTTTQGMRDAETRLLDQRIQRTEAQRRWTSFTMVVGVMVGASLLTLAKFAVNREIDVSVRGRAQLKILNASLEQRVDQRTAALQSEIAERKQAEERLATQTEELSRQAEELARSEREIRKLNEELEERVIQRTTQLEAANHELEAFTYSVSHDLRAPLRHIGGFSKILSEDFGSGLPMEAQSHLQRIQDGTHRMGLLVDELLNLARVGRHALNLQTTRLNLVVEQVVSLLQPEAEGRAVSWKIAELPFVECDPILVKQVFQNLLANALKFTRTREHAVIEISQRLENGQMVIAVADNGVGFNMKYKDKLFGVFQRLHRPEDFEGTGIGLATVQRIVHKHGGRIWAEAELDKGATFCFTLGASESTRVKPENVRPDEVEPTGVKASAVESKFAAAGAKA